MKSPVDGADICLARTVRQLRHCIGKPVLLVRKLLLTRHAGTAGCVSLRLRNDYSRKQGIQIIDGGREPFLIDPDGKIEKVKTWGGILNSPNAERLKIATQ
jgi:hypothetical protein